MSGSSERAPHRGGLGRVVVAFLIFAVLAPVALATLPLAVLLLSSRPRTRGEITAVLLAGGLSLWWLIQPGALPDQLVRSAAVVGTAAFVLGSLLWRSSTIHRALLSVLAATAAVTTGFLALGRTWEELRWWVEQRASVTARLFLGRLWASEPLEEDGASTSSALLHQLDTVLNDVARFTADYYPATVALEMIAGFALATAIYHRVSESPRGGRLGRFRDFRFSEHLGWAAVLSLVILLVPRLGEIKLAAGNLLILVAALYGLRGVAVASYGLSVIGAGGVLFIAATVFAVIFMPLILGGAIILGVVDAGVDLRRRWHTPPARG